MMHMKDILAELDRRNAEVGITRAHQAYVAKDGRWHVRLSFRDNGSELSFVGIAGDAETALGRAWGRADEFLSTVPGRRIFQAAIAHEPPDALEEPVTDDDIPF